MGILKYFNRIANAPDITADPLGGLARLPRRSAAEFRMAAWPLWYVQFRRIYSIGPASVQTDRILPHIPSARQTAGWVLIMLAAVFVYEVFDTSNTEQNRVLFVAIALGLVAMGQALLLWKRRDLRKIMALLDRNEALIALSGRIDQMVAAGQIPLIPYGWQGPVPPPLTGVGDEYYGWPRPWQNK